MVKTFTVYSRPECHLCEVMYGRLDQLQQEYVFDYQIINVDSHIDYKKRYGLLIPVLTFKAEGQSQEEVLCHYQLDELTLISYISKPAIE